MSFPQGLRRCRRLPLMRRPISCPGRATGVLLAGLLLAQPATPWCQSAPADSTRPALPGGLPAGGAGPAPAPAADPGRSAAPATQDSIQQPKSRADTVLVVKHGFNHRQQIITGSVVMTCLALM